MLHGDATNCDVLSEILVPASGVIIFLPLLLILVAAITGLAG
ncbi:MAG: hypothetical protein WB952_24030 [Terriglobales bacterium]